MQRHIIGELDVRGATRTSNRHAAELGMTVRRKWRSQSSGSSGAHCTPLMCDPPSTKSVFPVR